MKNLLQVLRDGGPSMIPIGYLSGDSAGLRVRTGHQPRHGRVIPRPFVRRFLEQWRETLAPSRPWSYATQNRSPVAECCGGNPKWGRPS